MNNKLSAAVSATQTNSRDKWYVWYKKANVIHLRVVGK